MIVTVGTITAYDGDDPTCTPHVYTAGTANNQFVDPGDGHVHILRDESGAVAKTIAVQLIPSGSPRKAGRSRRAGQLPVLNVSTPRLGRVHFGRPPLNGAVAEPRQAETGEAKPPTGPTAGGRGGGQGATGGRCWAAQDSRSIQSMGGGPRLSSPS